MSGEPFSGPAVEAIQYGNQPAIFGYGTDNDSNGVWGQSLVSDGVVGRSWSEAMSGVYGFNDSGGGAGVFGRAYGDGAGVYAKLEPPSSGYAAFVDGDIMVTGTLFASSKSFIIDHPSDPANKTITHVAIESDDYRNVYDGISTIGANGEVVVSLPSWFPVVNQTPRYNSYWKCGRYLHQARDFGD